MKKPGLLVIALLIAGCGRGGINVTSSGIEFPPASTTVSPPVDVETKMREATRDLEPSLAADGLTVFSRDVVDGSDGTSQLRTEWRGGTRGETAVITIARPDASWEIMELRFKNGTEWARCPLGKGATSYRYVIEDLAQDARGDLSAPNNRCEAVI